MKVNILGIQVDTVTGEVTDPFVQEVGDNALLVNDRWLLCDYEDNQPAMEHLINGGVLTVQGPSEDGPDTYPDFHQSNLEAELVRNGRRLTLSKIRVAHMLGGKPHMPTANKFAKQLLADVNEACRLGFFAEITDGKEN